MKSPTHREKLIEKQKDAIRSLERLETESEVVGNSTMVKAAKANSAKVDENDPIEILGKKIGRVLGFIAVGVLVAYLFATYIQPMG